MESPNVRLLLRMSVFFSQGSHVSCLFPFWGGFEPHCKAFRNGQVQFSLWCQLEHPSLPATTLGFPLLQVRPCEVLVCGRGRVGVGIHDLSDWFDYASSWISWLELPFPSKNSFRLGGLTSVGRFLWEFPWMPHTSLRPQYEDLRGHQTA